MSISSFNEEYAIDGAKMEEIEKMDKTRIIKIFLRLHPSFELEDLYRYNLIQRII